MDTALRGLLEHPSDAVKCAAAIRLLLRGDISVVPLLEELRDSDSITALDAQLVVEEWYHKGPLLKVSSAREVDIVEAYAKAARDHRQADVRGDYATANAAARQMAKIAGDLVGHNRLSELKQLLSDEDPSVRAWAASDLLRYGDPTGIPVLETLRGSDPPLSFTADMVLREFEAGRLGGPKAKTSPTASIEPVLKAHVVSQTAILTGHYYEHPNGAFVQIHGAEDFEEHASINIADRVHLGLDETLSLRAVVVEVDASEWEAVSELPELPQTKSVARLGFSKDAVDQYFYDPPSGVHVYMQKDGRHFGIAFSAHLPNKSIELGPDCHALLSNEQLCGFRFLAK